MALDQIVRNQQGHQKLRPKICQQLFEWQHSRTDFRLPILAPLFSSPPIRSPALSTFFTPSNFLTLIMNKISSLFFGQSIKSIAGARFFWAVASGWLLVSSAFAAPPATYRQWLQQYGLPADATGQGARSAMPNNDGIINMIHCRPIA